MSFPFLDYVPCDLVSYFQTVFPAWDEARRGNVEPVRQLLAPLKHVSYWPWFHFPNQLPAADFAGPKTCWGRNFFENSEPNWPTFLRSCRFSPALLAWMQDSLPEHVVPAGARGLDFVYRYHSPDLQDILAPLFLSSGELDFWAVIDQNLPALFADRAGNAAQAFLLGCLFFTLCCQLPGEEMEDCRQIGNEDIHLWEDYMGRTPEIQALWEFPHGFLPHERVAHLLAHLPLRERPFLDAVRSVCKRDFEDLVERKKELWPLSPELEGQATRLGLLCPEHGYPERDQEEFQAAFDHPDRAVLWAFLQEEARKKREMNEAFKQAAIAEGKSLQEVWFDMYSYWDSHQVEGFRERQQVYYNAIYRMETEMIGRFRYAAGRGWGMIKVET